MQPESETAAPSLALLQRQMMDAVCGATAAIALQDVVSPRGGHGAEAQLAIYANDARAAHINALRLAYPVVERLVGTQFFHGIAIAYAGAVSSRSGDLEAYGGDFAEFLDRHPSTTAWPWLGDMARFEGLLARLHRAPLQAALDRQQLGRIPADRLAAWRWPLVPRVAVFRSAWPIHRIWQAHQGGEEDLGGVDLASGPDRVLINLQQDVRMTVLGEGECRFHELLFGGAVFETALRAGVAADPQFDLAPVLQRAIDDRLLRAIVP